MIKRSKEKIRKITLKYQSAISAFKSGSVILGCIAFVIATIIPASWWN